MDTIIRVFLNAPFSGSFAINLCAGEAEVQAVKQTSDRKENQSNGYAPTACLFIIPICDL